MSEGQKLVAKSKELMKEMHPEVELKFSDGWFTAFKQRKGISYRSITNISQKHQMILSPRSASFTSSFAGLPDVVNQKER